MENLRKQGLLTPDDGATPGGRVERPPQPPPVAQEPQEAAPALKLGGAASWTAPERALLVVGILGVVLALVTAGLVELSDHQGWLVVQQVEVLAPVEEPYDYKRVDDHPPPYAKQFSYWPEGSEGEGEFARPKQNFTVWGYYDTRCDPLFPNRGFRLIPYSMPLQQCIITPLWNDHKVVGQQLDATWNLQELLGNLAFVTSAAISVAAWVALILFRPALRPLAQWIRGA